MRRQRLRSVIDFVDRHEDAVGLAWIATYTTIALVVIFVFGR